MRDVSRLLATNVGRDREKGTVTIDQKNKPEDIIGRFGMKDCNPTFTPAAGPEGLLNQPEMNLLDEKGRRR